MIFMLYGGRGRDAGNDHEIKMTDDPDVINPWHILTVDRQDGIWYRCGQRSRLIQRLEIIGPIYYPSAQPAWLLY